MAGFAIQTVKKVITEWGQCAGKIARLTNVTMVLTAQNHILLMGVVLARLRNVKTARSGAFFGTLFAMKASTILDAVFVHPIASME